MNKEEFIGKLQMCYFGDRNAFDEIVSVYDELKDRIDKAVEYIENTYIGSILEVHCGEEEEYTEPLLKLLKGDKE